MFASLQNFSFLVRVLAIFLCTVCYPDDRCSKIPCCKRKKSPGATLRASTELCPLLLQQYSHEKSGNWRHCSFRLFSVSFCTTHPSWHQASFPQTDISSAGNVPPISADQATGHMLLAQIWGALRQGCDKGRRAKGTGPPLSGWLPWSRALPECLQRV